MDKLNLVSVLKIILFLIVFAIFGISMCFLGSKLQYTSAAASALTYDDCTVIIDAGHGGEDCGAIGVNGVYEKDINFAVANGVAELLEKEGVNVILTRTQDKLLYTDEENIQGKKKYFDLKNRLAFAQQNPDALFVSIHMNKFEMESCRGMQVYFSTNTEKSKQLASSIQSVVTNALQPYNTRTIKATDGNIFLLDNAVGTAVLVECGFLSNYYECEKLSKKDYQGQLSFQIFCGIMEYIRNQRI